jgi:hypothetical protein
VAKGLTGLHEEMRREVNEVGGFLIPSVVKKIQGRGHGIHV